MRSLLNGLMVKVKEIKMGKIKKESLLEGMLDEIFLERESVKGKTFKKNKFQLGEDLFNKQIKKIVDVEELLKKSETERLRFYADLRLSFDDLFKNFKISDKFYKGYFDEMDKYMHQLHETLDLHYKPPKY